MEYLAGLRVAKPTTIASEAIFAYNSFVIKANPGISGRIVKSSTALAYL